MRDKNRHNLISIQDFALKLERNLNVVGKKEGRKSLCQRDYRGKSTVDVTKTKYQGDKFDHMLKEFDRFDDVVQNLSSKVIKMERNQQGCALVRSFQPRLQQQRPFMPYKRGIA